MFQNFYVVFYVTCRNVRNVTCRTYIRYVTDRHVRINVTLWFLTLRYVTLREGVKHALLGMIFSDQTCTDNSSYIAPSTRHHIAPTSTTCQ